MARRTQVFAGVILAGATVLPWATYKDLRSGHTTTLTAGRMGIVIAAVALLSLAVGTRSQLRVASVVLGCAELGICVATALSRISTANDLAAHASPGSGSHTAYAFGAAVAVAAAAVITIANARASTMSARHTRGRVRFMVR